MSGRSTHAGACGGAGAIPPHHAVPGARTPAVAAASDAFMAAMHAIMARMDEEMHCGPFAGDPDHDFLVMMIPHHQGAVDMAELVLREGRDALVRQLAEGILAAQRVEIAAMRGRRDALASGGDARDPFPALSGTRGE
ncbi:DUF305 domain-containing protein [Chelatococcus sp. SYSU_G07232]|uniref:DUF305 domain-containing protein n=1 Tax=Chelatococcus albus TaxID=3047466 RepID=A0ABT7AFJ5_9HYPH|nr:DUF305 domain-containing protein [Chelatococcus sp. SYSU_G07232]MDJ1157614.1 DUF305 domain-containing protein [Chelatococcus sp. SYSU_G07232]